MRTKVSHEKKLVVQIAVERAPYCKSGGLADFVEGFDRQLRREGINSICFCPSLTGENGKLLGEFCVPFCGLDYPAQLFQCSDDLTDTYLITCESFFNKTALRQSTYSNRAPLMHALFFAIAVPEAIRFLRLEPSLFILHDWQGAAVLGLPKTLASLSLTGRQPSSLVVVHNFEYQGDYSLELIRSASSELYETALMTSGSSSIFSTLGLALDRADQVVTVSPNYARELIEGQVAHRNLEALKDLHPPLQGWLNGIDPEIWNPEHDRFLPTRYGPKTFREGKLANKNSLCLELGLDPNLFLMSFISRLSDQKGIGNIFDFSNPKKCDSFLEPLFRLDLSFVLIASAPNPLHDQIKIQYEKMQSRFQGRLKILDRYDEKLAHRLFAASDSLLMPSEYEPCGLSQIYAMKYGTLPLVTSVGGLRDSVRFFNGHPEEGFGIKIESHDPASLQAAVEKAFSLWKRSPLLFQKLQARAMERDYSWKKNIRPYLEFIQKSLGEPRTCPS